MGNGNQSVDIVENRVDGTTSSSRIVSNGQGGYQKWGKNEFGGEYYINKPSVESDAYGQNFLPGSDTAASPHSEFGATADWKDVGTPSYDTNGNRIGTDYGTLNETGTYDNAHVDNYANKTFSKTTAKNGGGVESSFVGQIDNSGRGWKFDEKQRLWHYDIDIHGKPVASQYDEKTRQRTFLTSDGPNTKLETIDASGHPVARVTFDPQGMLLAGWMAGDENPVSLTTMSKGMAAQLSAVDATRAYGAAIAKAGSTSSTEFMTDPTRVATEKLTRMISKLPVGNDARIAIEKDRDGNVISVSAVDPEGLKHTVQSSDIPDPSGPNQGWLDKLSIGGTLRVFKDISVGFFAMTDIGAAINGIGGVFGKHPNLPTSDTIGQAVADQVKAAKHEYDNDNYLGALNHAGQVIGLPDWRDPNSVVAVGATWFGARALGRSAGAAGEAPRNSTKEAPHVLAEGNATHLSDGLSLVDMQDVSPHLRMRDIRLPQRGDEAMPWGSPLEGDYVGLGESPKYPTLSPKEIKNAKKADDLLAAHGFDGRKIFGDTALNDPARIRAFSVLANTSYAGKASAMIPVALKFSLDHAGPANPRSFANHYEYVKSMFDEHSKAIDYSGKRSGEKNATYAARTMDIESVRQSLANDVKWVESSGWRSRVMEEGFASRPLTPAVQSLDGLGFGDPVAAAYHAIKHRRELPDSEISGLSTLDAYHRSAAETVKNGHRVKIKLEPGGVKTIVFHRLIVWESGAKTLEAIVKVMPEGTVLIASYGDPKLVVPKAVEK
ncbi:hypothetical protein [Nocardia sp. NPDC004415]